MDNFSGYRCSICESVFTQGEVTYTCPKDGGNLNVILKYDEIAESFKPNDIFTSTEFSLWRYLPLLPIKDPGGIGTPLRSVGYTPIFRAQRLGDKLGVHDLWIKDESRNPTASFKDRASAIVVARAIEVGSDVVVTASTGNAGAALAGMSASIGQKAIIFAPRTAPPAKIAQLLVYGAQVYLVEGSYDDAFDLTIKASQEFGWYCRNTGYNPFTAEGKKTAAFEIWEWMARLRPKSEKNLSVFVSVGDGNIISGIHKGFKDLQILRWIDRIPRIYGVQAEGSAAIANAYFSKSEKIIPVSARTIADSISVDLPRDGLRAIRAARETEGGYIVVTDEDILSAIVELGNIGVFAEPAGAASFAGFINAVKSGLIHPDDPVLVVNTGSGLKDVRAAMQSVKEPPIIEPTLEALYEVIR